jgi:biotin operon repressor
MTAPLSAEAHALQALLARHIGAERGLSAAELARAAGVSERAVRKAISDLRGEGVAVCGHPRTGYYIAATADELERTCAFLRARAMHSLVLEARLRRISLPDLIGQLRVPT